RARPLRGRARPRLVRARPAPAPAARPPQRDLRRRDGRDLPEAPRPDRAAAGAGAARATLAPGLGEGLGRRAGGGGAVKAAVVGGGLAGIAAALELADAGASVTLHEARPRLGGATFSVERDGLWLDNGQHVFLRCCTEYLALLHRLGVESQVVLQERMSIPVLAPDGQRAVLERTGLPAPLHLTRSLLGYSFLGMRERVGVGRAALALRRVDLADDSLDEQTFGTWLEAHGQSP